MISEPPIQPPHIAVDLTEVGHWDRARIEHLTMIQAVIARLGGNGFFVKGWAITVAGIFFGFAVETRDPLLAIASIATTVIFWGLDAYYLYCERRFRDLYVRVQERDPTVPTFFMSAMVEPEARPLRVRVVSLLRTMARFPVATLYTGLIVMTIVVAALIGVVDGIGPTNGPSGPLVPAVSTPGPTPQATDSPTPSVVATPTAQQTFVSPQASSAPSGAEAEPDPTPSASAS